jgi:hypothetical protein
MVDKSPRGRVTRFLNIAFHVAWVVSVVVLLGGIVMDGHIHRWAPWLQRAGAIVVIIGTALAIVGADKLITYTKPPDGRVMILNIDSASRCALRGLCIVGVGTLVWGFGDIAVDLLRAVHLLRAVQ